MQAFVEYPWMRKYFAYKSVVNTQKIVFFKREGNRNAIKFPWFVKLYFIESWKKTLSQTDLWNIDVGRVLKGLSGTQKSLKITFLFF